MSGPGHSRANNMKKIRDLLILVIAVVLFNALANHYRWGFDDSDNNITGKRSGLSLYTDHKTGCQYFGKVFGPPTPRLDSMGKQVCSR